MKGTYTVKRHRGARQLHWHPLRTTNLPSSVRKAQESCVGSVMTRSHYASSIKSACCLRVRKLLGSVAKLSLGVLQRFIQFGDVKK